MTTLEDLYYGNISPHERYIKRGTRVDKLVKMICKNEEELNAGLTEKQKETFEKFKDCTSELSCITEREAFRSGFILATRIMVEVREGLEGGSNIKNKKYPLDAAVRHGTLPQYPVGIFLFCLCRRLFYLKRPTGR